MNIFFDCSLRNKIASAEVKKELFLRHKASFLRFRDLLLLSSQTALNFDDFLIILKMKNKKLLKNLLLFSPSFYVSMFSWKWVFFCRLFFFVRPRRHVSFWKSVAVYLKKKCPYTHVYTIIHERNIRGRCSGHWTL